MLISVTQMRVNILQFPKSYTEFFYVDGFCVLVPELKLDIPSLTDI